MPATALSGNLPAVRSFYSIVNILRHMNKNVKNVSKIIQNTSKRRNRWFSKGSTVLPRLYFYVFSFRFILVIAGLYGCFSHFYAHFGLFMPFCLDFLHILAHFVHIHSTAIKFRFLLQVLCISHNSSFVFCVLHTTFPPFPISYDASLLVLVLPAKQTSKHIFVFKCSQITTPLDLGKTNIKSG